MLVISNVEHLLMYVGHLHAFFRKMSIQVLCPFPNQVIYFTLLLSCMGSLYILGINPLSDPCFIDFFSTPFRCLFIILSPWLFFFFNSLNSLHKFYRLHPTYTGRVHRLPVVCLTPSGLYLLLPNSYNAPPLPSPSSQPPACSLDPFLTFTFHGTAALPRYQQGRRQTQSTCSGPMWKSVLEASLFLSKPSNQVLGYTTCLGGPGKPGGAKKQGYEVGVLYFSHILIYTETHRVCDLGQ